MTSQVEIKVINSASVRSQLTNTSIYTGLMIKRVQELYSGMHKEEAKNLA